MNILLFQPSQRLSPTEVDNELVEISNPETIKHVHEILKLNIGSELQLGEIGGLIGRGKIIELNEERLRLQIKLTESPPQKIPCTIILALPRPQQLKRILVHLSSLGVKQIHLLQTQRVEKNYWQSPSLKKIEEYLVEGLEQSVDTILPEVFVHKNFKVFIEKELSAISRSKQLWLAHPGNFPEASLQTQGEHVLMIGPEGGFISEEVDCFIQHGASAVSLGKRILKVETAIPVLLSKMFSF